MTTPMTNTSLLHEGINDPSPITRAVALGWYDGPTEGVLQLGDAGAAFRFVMLEQRSGGGPDDTDLRVYGLYPLPDDSFDRVSEILTRYHAPRWPVWCPVWTFPTEQDRRTVDSQIESILTQAGPLSWILVGDIGQAAVRALPVQLAQAS